MFGSELDKFKDDQKMIDNSISEQLKRLEELNRSWLKLTSTSRAKDIHNKHSESDRRRKEIFKKFKKAGDTYFEAADGVNRATVFYDDLEQVINQLKKDVGSFVNKRAKERVQAIVDAEAGTRNSGGTSSSFESEFGKINLQTPHRPPKPGVSPPPATSPSPSSYAYGGLPAPPSQPQPSIYQSLYGQQTQAPSQMQPPPPKPSSPQYAGPGYSTSPQSSPYAQQAPSPYSFPHPPHPSQSQMPYQQQRQSPYGPSQDTYQMPPQSYQQPPQQPPQQQYYQQPPAPAQNYPYYR